MWSLWIWACAPALVHFGMHVVMSRDSGQNDVDPFQDRRGCGRSCCRSGNSNSSNETIAFNKTKKKNRTESHGDRVFTILSSSLSSSSLLSAKRMSWVGIAQQKLQLTFFPTHADGRSLPWWVSLLRSLLENSSLSQIPSFHCHRSDSL